MDNQEAVDQVDLKSLVKVTDHSIAAAGVLRSEKQLAELSLPDRATFVREQILALNHIVDEARRKGAAYGINVGRALLVTKAELHHGEFQEWIERKCKLALSTAKMYMLFARRGPEALRKHGKNANEMSVRALREMVTDHKSRVIEHRRDRATRGDERLKENEIERTLLQIDHLIDHGDPHAVDASLLPELIKRVDILQKRLARRQATAAEADSNDAIPAAGKQTDTKPDAASKEDDRRLKRRIRAWASDRDWRLHKIDGAYALIDQYDVIQRKGSKLLKGSLNEIDELLKGDEDYPAA